MVNREFDSLENEVANLTTAIKASTDVLESLTDAIESNTEEMGDLKEAINSNTEQLEDLKETNELLTANQELLAACTTVLPAIRWGMTHQPGNLEQWLDCERKLVAAIAKATSITSP